MNTIATAARISGVSLPGHMELPYTDGLPVDNILQPRQQAMLTNIILPVLQTLHPDNDFCVAEDVGIYWKHTKKPLEGCKAPDWFYVPGVPLLLDGQWRRSYVMWKEEVPPLIVVELVLGNGAEEHDRTPQSGKFWVYEKGIRAPFYAIHDMGSDRLEVFELIRSRYRKMTPNTSGRFPIAPLGVELGIWEGTHQEYTTNWLRFWDAKGRMLPTTDERADQERQRAEKLLAKMRKLGISPNGE